MLKVEVGQSLGTGTQPKAQQQRIRRVLSQFNKNCLVIALVALLPETFLCRIEVKIRSAADSSAHLAHGQRLYHHRSIEALGVPFGEQTHKGSAFMRRQRWK